MDLSLMGAEIKSARIEKRFTLEKFSEKIGISRNFLWEIEAGRKTPALQTLYRISNELGISVDYLLGLSQSSKWLNVTDDTFSKIENMINKFDKNELNILYTLLTAYLENKD